MPFIPIEQTAQIEVRFLWDLQHVENTLYFHKSSVIGVGDIEILVADVRDHWVANMIPLQPNEVQLTEVYGRTLDNESGFEAVAVPATPTFGTYANNALPNNVTMSVTFRSGFTGRGSRGRNYWIGIVESQVVQNLVNADFTQDVIDAYTTMVGFEAVSAGWTWVVASRYLDGSPRPTGQTLEVVSVGVFDRVVDGQRRRLPGRGR
jgi:hypothetical protein